MNAAAAPRVGVIMGSQSDWPTLRHAAEILDRLGVTYETRIVSAHRTPDRLREYARTARERGLAVIIAGAGGAAHLPGMCAAWTSVPVLGVQREMSVPGGAANVLRNVTALGVSAAFVSVVGDDAAGELARLLDRDTLGQGCRGARDIG